MEQNDDDNNGVNQRQDDQTLRAVIDTFDAVPRLRLNWSDAFRMMGDAPLRLLLTFAKSKGYREQDFNAAIRAYEAESAMGRPILSCEDLVEAVVERGKLRATYDGMLKRPCSGRIQSPYGLANLTDDVVSRSAALGLGYRESLIRAEVARWIQRSKEGTLTRIEGTIFDAEADRCASQWRALGQALVMPSAASPDYVAAILKTVIWQVKRKMLRLPVYGHLMPILTGSQGNGKSTFIRKFLEPVAELSTFLSFKEALDSRNLGVWDSFVHVYDEMEHAEKADINAVKSAITGEKRSARVLGSNVTATVEQLSTSIGATNQTVGAVMRDATGMRRYAPVPTGHKPGCGKRGEVDWAIIDSLDYAALWRSVQVDDPRPADAVQAELVLLQEDEKAIEPVAYYLRYHLDARSFVCVDDGVTASALYSDFSDMMRDNFPAHGRQNVQSFGMKLATFEGEDWYPFARKERGRKGSVYFLKEASEGQARANILRLAKDRAA